jgi:hypothetical protein
MQPRTYVVALAGSALSLFIGVAAANLLLDPLAVFGTGLVPRGLDMNARYYRFGEHEAAADSFDGLSIERSPMVAPNSRLTKGLRGDRFTPGNGEQHRHNDRAILHLPLA